MPRSSVIPAVLAAFMVTLAVLASPVQAQAPPDSLPYVTSIRTIPAQPCDSIPTRIVVEGAFPNSCGSLLGHTGAIIYVSDPNPPCARCFPGPPVPWADTLDIGLLPAGNHAVILSMAVIDSVCATPPDTVFHHTRFEFAVHQDCQPPPPPPDPMAYINVVSITSERPSFPFICEGDSIRLRVGGYFPNGCYHLRSITHAPGRGMPPGPHDVLLVFDNACCAAGICAPGARPWEAELMLPPSSSGLKDMRLIAAEVCCRDSILPGDPIGSGTWPFYVVSAESCGVEPPPLQCLYPGWVHENGTGCDAFLGADSLAAVTMTVQTNVALAGLQGSVHAHDPTGSRPLEIHSIEPIGPATGMRVAWEPEPGGARFVLFAEQGAPIPPDSGGRPSQVLKITWTPAHRSGLAAEGVAPPDRWFVSWSDAYGSDVDGRLVPLCPIVHDQIRADYATICVGGGQCDLNGDALSDVRDLVLMSHCLYGIGPCPIDPATSLDCQGDHDFDFDDLVCCTQTVLGVPPCPGCPIDSLRTESGIALTFGTPLRTKDGFDVPLRIDGRGYFGAARLTFSLPPALSAGAKFILDDSSWLPVSRSSAGGLDVGMVALVDNARRPGYVDAIIRLPVPAGTNPDGRIELTGADLSGPDGVKLAVDLGAPAVRLGAGLGVSLSAARPNPFGASTAFRLTLDAPADAADLAVYDLSGRRIATIHKGPLAIGSHAFTWNGRTENGSRARAGVYFVRASAGGQVTKQKLVMLKE